VRAAVERARKRDVVIVAAAGNAHSRDETTPDPVPYPAAYDGVIGVGAIDQTGARVSDSQVGPFVDLVAPGGGVTVAANRTGDQVLVSGTSFAAPHVAAAAALVRSRFPAMTAPQVEERLRTTAGPARGGPRSDAYGYGEVDPFRAVNEVTGTDEVTAVDAPPMYDARAVAAREARKASTRRRFTALAVAGLVVAALVGFGAFAVPRGRRRGWHPGETPPAKRAERDDDDTTFQWSLGAPPALPHPDRAETERYVNMLPGRSVQSGRR
jgi:subtilisin family serine protease